jgi:hypothetical protein
MSLSVAIQMDPIELVNIDADSTFALALEAQARGHSLLHYLPQHLTFSHNVVRAKARPLQAGTTPAVSPGGSGRCTGPVPSTGRSATSSCGWRTPGSTTPRRSPTRSPSATRRPVPIC